MNDQMRTEPGTGSVLGVTLRNLRSKGPATAVDIARRMRVPYTTAGQRLRKLRRAGWVYHKGKSRHHLIWAATPRTDPLKDHTPPAPGIIEELRTVLARVRSTATPGAPNWGLVLRVMQADPYRAVTGGELDRALFGDGDLRAHRKGKGSGGTSTLIQLESHGFAEKTGELRSTAPGLVPASLYRLTEAGRNR